MELMMYENKVVAQQKMGRIEGFLPAFVPELEEVPKIVWNGTRIPARLWARIKSFMRHTQEKFSSEAQIRLYYNDQTNRWRALAWPQYIGTGLFSAEIAGHHENKEKLLRLVSQEKGWYEFGTVHHHCTASAFQSGTDHKDEIDRPGIHITLGHILSDVHDIHARFVTKKIQYKADLAEWIEGDLTSSSKVSYPAVWLEQCFEKPKVVYAVQQWRGARSFGSSAGSLGNGGDYVYVPGFGYRRREEANMLNANAAAKQQAWDWDDESDLDIPPKIKIPGKQSSKDIVDEALKVFAADADQMFDEFMEDCQNTLKWMIYDLARDLGDAATEDVLDEAEVSAMESIVRLVEAKANEMFLSM